MNEEREEDEAIVKGCVMLVGLLALCFAIGAMTNWIAGLVAFGVVCLALGVTA